eukprot:scaffold798_cov142-Skeletonema_dohrnii-CCMP3373.AAC.5
MQYLGASKHDPVGKTQRKQDRFSVGNRIYLGLPLYFDRYFSKTLPTKAVVAMSRATHNGAEQSGKLYTSLVI